MARLLIVHHTVSPATQELLEAVLDGARDDEIEGVEVRTEAALSATASDLFGADALILGTPANIGYMSGALKVFFDTVYYPAQETTRGLPYGLYVHGDNDTAAVPEAASRCSLSRTASRTFVRMPAGEAAPGPAPAVCSISGDAIRLLFFFCKSTKKSGKKRCCPDQAMQAEP